MNFFSRFSHWFSKKTGHSLAFVSALLVVIVWAILGPLFNFSPQWQLLINSFTTIITFLMVFVILNSQNRETMAIQIKLDELIRAIKGAKNNIIVAEELSEEDLEKLYKHYETLALHYKTRKQEKRKRR